MPIIDTIWLAFMEHKIICCLVFRFQIIENVVRREKLKVGGVLHETFYKTLERL